MENQRHLDKLLRIGNKIASLRKEQRLTQQQLAHKAKIHRVRLSEIENGGSCSVVSLIDILLALDKLDLMDDLLKSNESIYDDVFDEKSSSVFTSAKELKQQRSKERSNTKLPDNLFNQHGK